MRAMWVFAEMITFCDDFLSLLSVAVASLLHKKPIQHFYELMGASVSSPSSQVFDTEALSCVTSVMSYYSVDQIWYVKLVSSFDAFNVRFVL